MDFTRFHDDLLLRRQLIEGALKWKDRYKVIPDIVGAIGELDASLMLGHSLMDLRGVFFSHTNEGFDFIVDNVKYQVKSTRNDPEARKSKSKRSRIDKIDPTLPFDRLIWIEYDATFTIIQAKILTRDEVLNMEVKKEDNGRIPLLVRKIDLPKYRTMTQYEEINASIKKI